MAATVVLNGARALIGTMLRNPANASMVSAASKRLGGTQLSAARVIQAAKDNPVSTALVLMELGSQGAEALEALRAENAEVDELIATLGYVPDKVSQSSSVLDITQFSDEFKTIDDAADVVGGISNLLALKRALMIDPSVITLRLQVRDLAK